VELESTTPRIDREQPSTKPKPAEPEDPGSSPGGPAPPLNTHVKFYGITNAVHAPAVES